MFNIVGIDEVGRGPWAGPITACAVRLNEDVDGLDDSKKLSKERRIKLSKSIRRSADVGIGWVSPEEIDRIGLTEATTKAMSIAYNQIRNDEDDVVIDGNIEYLNIGERVVVAAESKYDAVAAASIIAKTARDRYMEQMDKIYIGYDFKSHNGYGTARHKELIARNGIQPIHRKSFKPIKIFINE